MVVLKVYECSINLQKDRRYNLILISNIGQPRHKAKVRNVSLDEVDKNEYREEEENRVHIKLLRKRSVNLYSKVVIRR